MDRKPGEFYSNEPEYYICLYCKYDEEKGMREWNKLINTKEIEEIDIDIARVAIKQKDVVTAINIINLGSPQSQSIENKIARQAYAMEIVAKANRKK